MEVFSDPGIPAPTVRECAEEVLAVVPSVWRTFRGEMRAHRPDEFSLPQFRALIFLNRHAGASVSAVAGHVGLALSSTSQLVDGLMKRGYVARDTAASDRRRAALSLTAEGRAILEQARTHARARIEAQLARLTDDERRAVTAAMAALARAFDPTSPCG
jgi:DNA-binding MarR family transcriptional regulator